MVKTMLLIAFVMANIQFGNTQSSDTLKMKKYYVWLDFQDSSFLIKKALIHVTDSTLILADYFNNKGSNEQLINIDVKNVSTLKLLEKGKTKRHFLRGMLFGFTIGTLTAWAFSDSNQFFSFNRRELIVVYGIQGWKYGGLLGLLSGATRISIPLNGDADLFKKRRKDLLKF